MNKNQKRVRKHARKNNGQAFNVHPAYDKTCTPSPGRPTNMSFTVREIPGTRQPRLSKAAKVGRP